ncbi:unnamed protein product [Thelazia callipaeda]|uniref:Calpain catalytic domain-containing protein n=1 Tax=Thelazia callipaeda TaxID=103827 RepID=A0A158RC25_THECL|nr:unnamed protein product [Thelazia callipaeda]
MAARSTYLCAIQTCNVILIIIGLVAVGLAGSQFFNLSLGHYRMIDLRLLNWIYILAGLIGLYTLSRNHGTVVAKALHCVSIVVAMYTAAFYCITLFRIIRIHDILITHNFPEHVDLQYAAELNFIAKNYEAKLVICSLMIALPALACLAAVIAAVLIDRVVVVTQPTWPQYSRSQNKKYRLNRIGLAISAATKLLLALFALALTIFLQYEHQLISNTDPFVMARLDHFAALLVIVSAVIDMHSSIINRQSAANYKVAIGIAIVAAVWCLKTLDIGMYPFYYKDIQNWRGFPLFSSNASLSESFPLNDRTEHPIYLVIISEGILIGIFALLFGLNVVSAVQASKCTLNEFNNEDTTIVKSIAVESRCLGFLHFIWGIFLMGLVLLGLIDVPWNANYIGADLIWLAVLLFVTGLLYFAYSSSNLTAQFVLAFVCFTCGLEKMCATINLVYQSATYPSFTRSPEEVFLGRLVLHSVQLLVSFFVKSIHMVLLLGNMFYGIILVGCHVVFALGYWRFSESPLEIPYFRMGNGLLVFGISILQAISMCIPALLLPVTVLNVTAASVALFMISYSMSNTYFLAALLSTVEGIRWIIIEVALILTASATLACVICTFCATFAIVRNSTRSISTIVPYEENNYGTLRTLVTPQLQTPPMRHMEEQSIYWSTDENPYYYQTSKRYYDQPYKIDSGFYGYALVSPQMLESPYAIMGNINDRGDVNGPYYRNMISSAAQTKIGHIFN